MRARARTTVSPSEATPPGWERLIRATEELRAAELLIRDPVAASRTAWPHLRGYWQGVAAAAREAGLGQGDELHAWLAAEIPGVDAKLRAACRRHLERLEDEGSPPNRRQLRAHLDHARRLLAALEPQIGGEPLRVRKRRVLWGSVGAAIVLLPILIYAAVHTEVPGTGPWRAAYFTDRKLDREPFIVRENQVNHDWGKKAPLEQVPPEKWSARWDTCVRVDEDGPVVVQINANDGARVFVDGEPVIDAWKRDKDTRRRGVGSGTIELTAGVHHLRVEYFQGLGSASLELAASFNDEVPAAIPRDRLSYPGDELDEDEDPCAATQ